MQQSYEKSGGLSEVVSSMLIVILVIALGAILFAIFSGALDGYFQKTSLVAATADVSYVPVDDATSIPVFDVLPVAGEPFYLAGQQDVPSGSVSASFLLIGPDSTSESVALAAYTGTSSPYGKPLYIYRGKDFTYSVSDSIADKKSEIHDIPKGTWTIKMVDNTADVPLSEMTVTVPGTGYTVNPYAPTAIWTNGTTLMLVNSSGYLIPFTNHGVTSYVDYNGLQMFKFDGTSYYIQGEDNPDLDFTGDLSLSLWLDPDTTSGYHQIVGKGQSGDTNENYELFLINGKLYFEWTDRTTGQIYHIETDSSVVTTDLRYVTVTVDSGTPTIYYNGVAQSISYYQSNTPGSGKITNPALIPSVNLKENSNTVTIGKERYPS